MRRLQPIFLLIPLIIQTSCTSLQTNKSETRFFEAKPSIKIQTKNGIDKKEANMILEMYRMLSVGNTTVYYSEAISEKENWVSRKKGHWSYKTMAFPILINKKNGNLRQGTHQYNLEKLVELYREKTIKN